MAPDTYPPVPTTTSGLKFLIICFASFVALINNSIVSKFFRGCFRSNPLIFKVLKGTPAAGTIFDSNPRSVPTNKISSFVTNLRSFKRSINAIIGYMWPPVPPPEKITLIFI